MSPTVKRPAKPAAKNKTTKRKTATVRRPKITVPNPESIQQALNQINATLNDPKYQEQLKKLAQLSVANSLMTVRKLGQLSERITQLDSGGLDKMVSSSVSDLIRLSLQFNSDLLGLIQKMSNQTVDILDKATTESESETTVCGSPAE
jgi:hypothetical protein